MAVFRCPFCSSELLGWPPLTTCENCEGTVHVCDGVYLFTDAPAIKRQGEDTYVGYDDVAEGYDRYLHPPDLQRQLFSSYAEVFSKMVNGPLVLDLGCGPGSYALALAMRGKHVVAGDVSIKMLSLLSSRISDVPADSTLPCRISAYDLPLVDHCIDAVLALNLLHFVGDPQKVVHEARRVLRERGFFIVTGKIETSTTSSPPPARQYYSEALRSLGATELRPLGWTSREIRDRLSSEFQGGEMVTDVVAISFSYPSDWELAKLRSRYTLFQIGIPKDVHDEAISLVNERLEEELGLNWQSKTIECTVSHTLWAFAN